MKKNTVPFILLLLAFFAGSASAFADTGNISKRCFVVMVSPIGDTPELGKERGKVWQMGKEAEDVSALEKGLGALGEVSVVKLKTCSVLFVKLGQLELKALDEVIHIDSFTGSPAGLLARMAKETGTNWIHTQLFSFPHKLTDTLDNLSRISMTDFRGSIRQLLAETIPPWYGSLAFDIRCFPDGGLAVTQPGAAQIMEWQFRADHVSGILPKPVNLSDDERKKEQLSVTSK